MTTDGTFLVSTQSLGQSLISVFNLRSTSNVLEFGCKNTNYIDFFSTNNVKVKGIRDLHTILPSSPAKNIIDILDLRSCLKSKIEASKYIVTYSIGVEDYIDNQFEKVFLDNLCWSSTTIFLIIVFEENKQWFIDEMDKRNYIQRSDLEEKFVKTLSKRKEKQGIPLTILNTDNILIFKAIQFTGRF